MTYKGSTDKPAKIDMFGISNYISGLCSFITDCDTPMTIAIQGDWGSGKTSVMEMVKDSIDKKVVHCVWFNTWQFSQFNSADTLSLSLIETIIDDLGIDGGETVNKMRGGLGQLGAVMASVSKRAIYAGAERFIGEINTTDLKSFLERKEEITETLSDLKGRFQDCVNDAVKRNNVDRILVFIDDLDRLQPLRAVELLEVLKIFLDCEKCVFVLAIDYNVVVSGVKSKYGSDFDENKGRSFFDKIIQVPFKMPVAQYDISNFVKKTLADVAGIACSDTEIKNYVSLINTSIGSNPRSMKRLFNSYLLLLKVVDKELIGKGNIGKKDLFATLCMQQRFEHLYNYIVMNRENIDPELFGQLSTADDIKLLLKQEGIYFKHGEAEEIQAFLQCFNKMVATVGGEDGITAEDWNRVKELLGCSSVIATEKTNQGVKKRPTFVYKGDTYMAQGANKMNLSNLALRLIMDYAKDTDITTDALMNMINAQITCYTTVLKKAGLGQIADRSNPIIKQKGILDLHFSGKDEIICLHGKELLVSKGWGAPELLKLIDILGYNDKVNTNMK